MMMVRKAYLHFVVRHQNHRRNQVGKLAVAVCLEIEEGKILVVASLETFEEEKLDETREFNYSKRLKCQRG
jgi:hypothetical protein